MCTGKCSFFIAITLYQLALLSVICNILLFFPDWKVTYAKEGNITEEVKYMGGIIGGGVLALIPALYIHLTGEQGCCANRFGMFISIIFAAAGVAGAAYSFIVALVGLSNGPLCKTEDGFWERPLKDSNFSYMTNFNLWTECTEPKKVVQFNMGLFITLMVASILQALLCVSQIINGFVGCLCGTCNEPEVRRVGSRRTIWTPHTVLSQVVWTSFFFMFDATFRFLSKKLLQAEETPNNTASS